MIAYLKSAHRQFEYYKYLGEKAMEQLSEAELHWQPGQESNSIAAIVRHLWGNMLSRWTNFLTEDGEKPWRNRDEEFDANGESKAQVMAQWNAGWKCLLDALGSITDEDLERIIYIRNEGHTVLEAINRQIAHYSYHVGQIVYIAKSIRDKGWQTLSIPRNQSKEYNAEKFAQQKAQRHFTDSILGKEKDEL